MTLQNTAIISEPIMVSPEVSVRAVARLMQQQQASCVLISDRLDAEIFGIFTQQDLVHCVAQDCDLTTTAIATVASYPVITISSHDQWDISAILALMRSHDICHLPVIDDRGIAISIITPNLLSNALELENQSGRAADISDRQVLEQERELLLCSERYARVTTKVANQQWQNILESISEAFVSIDLNWRILYINPYASTLIGMPASAIVGQDFWQVFYYCQGNIFGETYVKAMATKKFQEIEDFHPVLKTWLSVRAFPHEYGLSLFVRDISETRKLKLERDRLFDHSPQIMVTTDLSGNLLQINPIWESILGYSVSESLEHSFIEFVHPQDLEKTIAHMQVQALSYLPGYDFEIRYLHKDGSIVWLSWNCIPFAEEQRIYGFARDITEQKFYAQTLERINTELEAVIAERTADLYTSEEKFRKFFDQAPIGIAVSDPLTHQFMAINHCFCKLLGYSEAEMLRQTCFSISPQTDWKAEQVKATALLNGEIDFYKTEMQYRKKDGGLVPGSLTLTALRDVSGIVTNFLGMVEDISDRKVAEQQAIKREQYLKAIVAVQNQLLANPFNQAIPQVLQILGEVTDSSRTYLFQNHPNAMGEVCTSQLYEWSAPGITSQAQNPFLQNINYALGCPRWLKLLSQGNHIYETLADFQPHELAELISQGIHSILAFPLQVQGELWGFFGFDQCNAPKIWESSEIILLHAVASAIGIAIERQMFEDSLQELNQKLNQSKDFAQRIATTTPSLIYIYDLEKQRAIYSNRNLKQSLGYDDQDISLNGQEFLDATTHPDDLPLIAAQFAKLQASNTNQVFEIEYRMRDQDGEWRWFLSQDTVFTRSDTGKVTQFIGAATDISDRKLAETRLQESLEEKEVLLKEIHHRVKNNLNVIDGILKLQSQTIANPQLKQLLLDNQKRIYSMVRIHEQLYQANNLSEINFADYIENLAQKLYCACAIAPELITIEIIAEPISVDVLLAIPIGLILNELLTNAFKHAFPKGRVGNLKLDFYCSHDRHLHLWVKDDGIGMNINSPSTDSFGNSLGMKLVKILVQQLRANLDISQAIAPATGTIIHLCLPEN